MRRVAYDPNGGHGEARSLKPGDDGYWHDRANRSWETLQALDLSPEHRKVAGTFQAKAVPLTRTRRESMLRCGLLAVTGDQHVAILGPSYEAAWELRDVVIEALNVMGYDPDDIRRLHGWDERAFRRFVTARHMGEVRYVESAGSDKHRRGRRQTARSANQPRNDWMDDALILILRDKKKESPEK